MDFLLFAVFPYVAVTIAIVVGLYRYFTNRFSFTSGSSEFVSKRGLFWGSTLWHYAIVIVLLAHLLALLLPGVWSALVGEPVRLYVVEITGLVLGTMTVVGIAMLIWRRTSEANLVAITPVLHWVVLASLAVQVVAGLYIALFHRWGSVWYVSSAVPWLWSLVQMNPQLQSIATLPWVFKLHAFNAFVLVALFPFTRLVHIFTFPITYLWRSYQVFVWNRGGSSHQPGVAGQVEGPQA